jgi:hypothetical protein
MPHAPQRPAACAACLLGLACALSACGGLSVPQKNSLYGSAIIGAAAVTPGTDLEQTYYLGSFDPRGQLPPAIYRIRLRGQASILNSTRFASSWVPAAVVDSLAGSANIKLGKDDAGSVSISAPPDNVKSSLEGAGRRLMLFGPEGFRKAPEGHRLVVIMGSSPENVEQAFASALGTVAQARFGRSAATLDRDLFGLLLELGQEREQLKALGDTK